MESPGSPYSWDSEKTEESTYKEPPSIWKFKKHFRCKIGFHWWSVLTHVRTISGYFTHEDKKEYERHCIFCGKVEVYRRNYLDFP